MENLPNAGWDLALRRVAIARMCAFGMVATIVLVVLLGRAMSGRFDLAYLQHPQLRLSLFVALVFALALSHYLPRRLMTAQLGRGTRSTEWLSSIYLSVSLLGNALREGVGLCGVLLGLLIGEYNFSVAFGAVAITLICVNWPSETALRKLVRESEL